MSSAQNTAAKPFVKWAGGKRALLPTLKRLMPDKYRCLYEPFVGGGALLFSTSGPASISDVNAELIIAYNVIKDDPSELLDALRAHSNKHTSKYYYHVRSRDPGQMSAVDVAARFIYLNKSCFNGLYRVNKSGGFNVPMGRHKQLNIVDKATIMAAHERLANVRTKWSDYRGILGEAETGDFVYMDPPYAPLNDKSFTSYSANGFTEEDQRWLAKEVRSLAERGVMVMLSNSDTPLVRELYDDGVFDVISVRSPRNINSKASERGPVMELVIRSYT